MYELTVDAATGQLPPLEVNSASFFTVRATEKDYFPQGFPWEEPASDTVFDCVEIKNLNLGNFQTTYRQWLMQAKAVTEPCTEDIVLKRPSWWAIATETEVVFTVTVNPQQCDWCPAGSAPDADCACQAIVIPEPSVPVQDIFSTTDVAVDTETTISMDVGANVIFREWAVEGQFAWTFPADLGECISLVGEPYVGIYHQEIMVTASKEDCRSSLTFTQIVGESTLKFNFIVWPSKVPEVSAEMQLV